MKTELPRINNVVGAVAIACSKDETREPLGHVLIKDGETVASNGRLLLYAATQTTPADELPESISGNIGPLAELIPAKIIKSAINSLAKGVDPTTKKPRLPACRTAHLCNSEIKSTDLQSTHCAKIPEYNGTRDYPDYKKIIPPADRSEIRAKISVENLEKIVKAAKMIAAQGIEFMVSTIDDEFTAEPIRILMRGRDERCESVSINGVVMPMYKKD